MAEYKNLVIFLSTDKHPSPFDTQVIYDAGADHVISYGNVTPEEAKTLTLDIMFPRGPKGVQHTTLFVGGGDIKKAEEITKVAKETMFPPFEMAMVSDPRGAYTTSSALVAKTEDALKKNGMQLKGSNVTILAGAGLVGSIAATLLAMEGANVNIADIAVDYAEQRAKEINEKVGGNRVKAHVEYPKEGVYPACKDAHIIMSTGPPGVTLLKKDVLEKLSKCKVLADTNAVSPPGIEGLKPTWDGKEVVPGVTGIGALAIGSLKLRVEANLIKKAIEAPSGYFGYNEAFETARELLRS